MHSVHSFIIPARIPAIHTSDSFKKIIGNRWDHPFRPVIKITVTVLFCMCSALDAQTLGGMVVDTEQTGIEGATVRLMLSDMTRLSDSGGYFSFNVNTVSPQHGIVDAVSGKNGKTYPREVFALNGKKLSVPDLNGSGKIVSLDKSPYTRGSASQMFVFPGGAVKGSRKQDMAVLQAAGEDTLLVTHDDHLFRKIVIPDVNATIDRVVMKSSDDIIAWYWNCLDGFYLRRDDLPFDPFGFPKISSLYASLGDPFTIYMTKEAGRRLTDTLDQKTVGLGIRIDSVAGGYRIDKVYPGTPADDAGLLEDDVIIMIDSIESSGITVTECMELLRGEAGETVQLVIQREEQTETFSVTREVLHLPTVYRDSIDQKTVLITITGFFLDSDNSISGGTSDEFGAALSTCTWAENLIIDLRLNGGGFLDQCIGCVSWLMEPGLELFHWRSREYDAISGTFHTVDSSFYSTEQTATFRKNVVLLTDSMTASAAEIFIVSLKEVYPEIPVVGTNTYGKAFAQVIIMGPDSGMAMITSTEFESLSGISWNETGLSPDYQSSPGKDPIEIAMALFGGGLNKRWPGGFRVPITERKSGTGLCVIDKRNNILK